MESVFPEDLYLHVKVDSEEQQRHAMNLAEDAEAELISIGIPLNDRTRQRFGAIVKAMTLHEMDHPGEELPQGIRQKINNLKFNH